MEKNGPTQPSPVKDAQSTALRHLGVRPPHVAPQRLASVRHLKNANVGFSMVDGTAIGTDLVQCK
jgi:hypothetical protein